ncbi:ribonuclease H, partial [Trifolium pratense]
MKVGGEDNGDWFKSNVCTVLGKGDSIRFWQIKWLGNDSLQYLYPQLYNKALNHEAVVTDVGSWNDSNWQWHLQWVEELLSTEMKALSELTCILTNISPTPDSPDRRKWIPNHAGIFSVRSTYVFLQNRDAQSTFDSNVVDALQNLWENDVPSK